MPELEFIHEVAFEGFDPDYNSIKLMTYYLGYSGSTIQEEITHDIHHEEL